MYEIHVFVQVGTDEPELDSIFTEGTTPAMLKLVADLIAFGADVVDKPIVEIRIKAVPPTST